MSQGDEASSRLFRELLGILRTRGIAVRVERFKTPPDRAGGYCELHGNKLVLLHAGSTEAEQLQALIEAIEAIGLSHLKLTGADLSPPLLARLNRRGRMPWPHRTQAPALKRALYRMESNVSLSTFTTTHVGGPAFRLATATSKAGLFESLERAAEEELPVLFLGGGSNVVVSDRGVHACVVVMKTTGVNFSNVGDGYWDCTVEAGTVWDDFVAEATRRNLQGIECLSGIPGSVGATPIQNVGAYGQEVSETIQRVGVLDTLERRDIVLSAKACEFSYRNSAFKSVARGRFVVTDVTYRLKEGGTPCVKYAELERALKGSKSPSLSELRHQVLMLRRSKSMVYDPNDENHRSCGSFFLNVLLTERDYEELARRAGEPPPSFNAGNGRVKVAAAWLIERAGFPKGTREGNVGISSRHSLSLVVHPGGNATELVRLAHRVRNRVEDTFGVRLHPEPEFWGFDDFEDGLPTLLSI